jgi:hyperosmotically inducible protein
MKTHTGLLLLGTTLVTIFIAGCNKPPEMPSTQPNATTGTHINDSDVNRGVRSALVQDEILKGFGITVETINGDVNLTGVVDNQGQSDYADKLVRGVDGVHTIHNHLSIKK